MIRNNDLEKQLKLVTQIKTSNMYLYNGEGKLEKYDTIRDILIAFYNIRIIKYKERREKHIALLKKQLEILFYKIKFITDFISNTIIIAHKKKDDVIHQLEALNYPKLSTTSDEPSYSYTFMGIYSLTEEKIKELTDEHDNLSRELARYESITSAKLWEEELLELKDAYIKWLKDITALEQRCSRKIHKK